MPEKTPGKKCFGGVEGGHARADPREAEIRPKVLQPIDP